MQNFDRNIGFWENANFFAENWQKSQKIVIITSTPGRPALVVSTFFCEQLWLDGKGTALTRWQGCQMVCFQTKNPNLGKI
jgi:hypothetical protein